MVFFDASGAHSEENLSGAPVELIRVELKQGRRVYFFRTPRTLEFFPCELCL
jgi:hypothetical protein